jgi:hypothetical protein
MGKGVCNFGLLMEVDGMGRLEFLEQVGEVLLPLSVACQVFGEPRDVCLGMGEGTGASDDMLCKKSRRKRNQAGLGVPWWRGHH